MTITVEINRAKCQGYKRCTHWAPETFTLDDEGKVVLADPPKNSDEELLKAAKSCPYRVIAAFDETATQLFPPPRPKVA